MKHLEIRVAGKPGDQEKLENKRGLTSENWGGFLVMLLYVDSECPRRLHTFFFFFVPG